MIAQMRDQFFTLLVDIGFVQPPRSGTGRGKHRFRGLADLKDASFNLHADNLQLVTAVVAAGLYVPLLSRDKRGCGRVWMGRDLLRHQWVGGCSTRCQVSKRYYREARCQGAQTVDPHW